MGSLFDLEATVTIFESGRIIAYSDWFAEHIGVAGVTHAPAHPLCIGAVLAIADEWNRVVQRDVELLLEFTVSECCARDERIKIPGFGHPATRHGIDDATCDL